MSTETRGSDASTDQAVLELDRQLGQLRAFITWTSPLYLLFLAAGLFATQFEVTLALALLLAVLAAFGILDVLVLASLRSLRETPKETPADLARVRARLERLSRFLLLGGGALGAAGAASVVTILLGTR